MTKSSTLPTLPYPDWRDSKLTLHLFCQIIGKIRLALMPPRNHWWHVTLYVTNRGLTTQPMPYRNRTVEITLDLIDHRIVITTDAGAVRSFAVDTYSVAEFYERLFVELASLDIDVSIRPVPYDMPFTTPFPEDHDHAEWNRDAIQRYHRLLLWSQVQFAHFCSGFNGKTTPIHLYWHSFDLAVTRFSGRLGPEMQTDNPVEREAYSHEVISFGFWPGDDTFPEPAYYSYTYPEPQGLREQPLKPAAALWAEKNGGALAVLRYDDVRADSEPDRALLDFLESTYQAGARLAGWDKLGFPS